jgi:putative ABC transport system permease protein
MSLWKIAWRSIQQRALASSLTGISMALGVMLVVAVLVVHGVIDRSFLNNSGLGYNLVVGAKGGRLDLVLNSVYYLARPVENIPYTYYLEFTEGKFKGYTDKAIPLCLGDMYQDFRVIGTTPAFFNDLDYGGKKYAFADGRNFEPDEYYGAVIGATVARETGLKVRDTFQPAHGAGPDAHEHDPFTVLGILEPTGTPNDRALFINMEGFFLIPEHAKPGDDDAPAAIAAAAEAPKVHADASHAEPSESEPADSKHKHEAQPGHTAGDDDEHAQDEHQREQPDHDRDHAGHDHHGHDHSHAHEPLPVEQREVTAILVLTAGAPGVAPGLLYGPELKKAINKDSVAQAVEPIREMAILFSTFVDPLRIILLSLTVMIVIVSGIGILVSIYNSMSERQHEIAVVRALGAGRRTVMLLVLLESILLSLGGGLLGWLVGHGLIAALSPWIAARTGVSIGFLQFVGYESVIIPGLIVLASLVGYLPALAAYRTDVAKALSATP